MGECLDYHYFIVSGIRQPHCNTTRDRLFFIQYWDQSTFSTRRGELQ